MEVICKDYQDNCSISGKEKKKMWSKQWILTNLLSVGHAPEVQSDSKNMDTIEIK